MPKVDRNIEILYNSTLEGAMLSFFTISTIAVCGNDGVWRPSPAIKSEDMCTSPPAPDPIVVPVVSSLSAFIAGSVTFFITGCLCGHRVHISGKKKKKSTSTEFHDDVVQSTHNNVLYEDVVTRREQVETLELKENVAYGPVR